jgi:hypothetical protein
MTQLKQPLLQQQNLNNTASSASPNPQSSVSSQNPQPLTNPVSSNGSYNPTTKTPSNQNNWKNQNKLSQLQQPLLPKSNRFANVQLANSNNSQRNVSQVSVNSRNSNSIASQLQAPANLRNPPQTILQEQPPPPPPPPPPPNAQPQGFNTLKAQSRCSIL